jgi:hypothetical protein
VQVNTQVSGEISMKKSIISIALAALAGSSAALAADYEVTITNVTSGIVFTPIYVVSHKPGVTLFELGEQASDELAALAEGGSFASLDTLLKADPRVVDSADSGAMLLPGENVTVTVSAPKGKGQVSLAAMMLPTNDGFIALNGVEGPRNKQAVSYHSPGYDAGSEPNDELCISIPGGGPCGGGEGGSANAGGEDYVHIHSGIHGIGDLTPAAIDWRNPTAYITIKRVNNK